MQAHRSPSDITHAPHPHPSLLATFSRLEKDQLDADAPPILQPFALSVAGGTPAKSKRQYAHSHHGKAPLPVGEGLG
jgi:hypothetical protein